MKYSKISRQTLEEEEEKKKKREVALHNTEMQKEAASKCREIVSNLVSK